MPNLFKEYGKNAIGNGVSRNLFSFLFFLIMWSLGACCGVVLVVLGVRIKSDLDREQEEIDKMVARLNEQGPNN
jgi:hypothetical protein